ncbi:MAG: hypothetical protein NZ693_09245, partial [Thermoflexales bacterium]|nr:hypothetical protein [Thermoflexales bacterium]
TGRSGQPVCFVSLARRFEPVRCGQELVLRASAALRLLCPLTASGVEGLPSAVYLLCPRL